MGFFSKNKTEEPMPAPPMPAPSQDNSNAPAMPPAPSADMPAPPAPGMDAPAPAPVPMGAPTPEQAPNSMEVPDGSSLTPPSLPGGNLDDIKSQVIGQNDSAPSRADSEPVDMPEESDSSELDSNEDLFSMFGVENSEPSSSLPSSESVEASNMFETSQDDSDSTHDMFESMHEPEDTNVSHATELNFEHSKPDETMFLTTTQFKALLEVVDSVKDKIKLSTETHLKLMDMKAEEDVEYESLRKNFQFIEDKLYELDSILFEK